MQKRVSKAGFLKSNFSFLAQFLRNPKEIGSILPSSPLLGKTMAGFVPDESERYIVELGPGTGPITKALVKAGFHEENMLCIEQSQKLVDHLHKRFPKLNVVQGDACDLCELLGDKNGKVNAIVSSLPLKSIPGSIVEKIIDQMDNCLQDDGIIIQFTYDLRKKRSPLLSKFTRVNHKVVLGNVPPARVDVFKKKLT
jgi:phosphatidylethanolamine/phosphatidyl-N-methylethanolamine N-methyltransferase